ncbi:MAG: hypothetical protein AB9869_37275 [Verrucomicrobiia bacterium]
MHTDHPTTLECPAADLDATRERLAEQGYRIVSQERTPDGWRLMVEPCGCDLCRSKRNEP